MNLPDILNVAIGLVLLYFLLSTLCSTLVELLAAFVQFREEILYVTINHLLDDDEATERPWSLWRLLRERLSTVTGPGGWRVLAWLHPAPLPGDQPDPGSVAEKFWAHAKIKSATLPGRDAPVSLDAATFAAVLIDVAIERDSVGELPTSRVALERRLQPAPGSLLSTRLRNNLITLGLSSEIPLGASGEGLWATFRTNLGRWYDEAMARATDRYRRRMTRWLLVAGFIAAALFNADTIRAAFVLSRDTALAQLTADYARELVEENERAATASAAAATPTTTATPPAGASSAVPTVTPGTAPGVATTAPATDTPPPATRHRLAAEIEQLQLIEARGFPIGWHFNLGSDWTIFGIEEPPTKADWGEAWWWRALGIKLLGLLLTAVAVAQGGPFWYDLLRKLANLRKGGGDSAAPSPVAAMAAATGKNPAELASTKEMIPLEAGRDLARVAGGVDFRKAYWLARAAEVAYADDTSIQALVLRDWRFHTWRSFSKTVPVEVGGKTIKVDTQAFFAADDHVMILAFRGTEPHKLNDIVTDLRLRWTEPAEGVTRRVHRGFHAALAAVLDDIATELTTVARVEVRAETRGSTATTPPPPRHLYLTGHSLGGALATLCLARLREPVDAAGKPDPRGQPRYAGPASLYTFGCPLVGDEPFADEVERAGQQQLFRFVHGADVVPLVPPELLSLGAGGQRHRYCHAGEMFHLAPDGTLQRQVSSFNRWLGQAASAVRDLRQASAQAVGDHGMHHYVTRCHELALKSAVI